MFSSPERAAVYRAIRERRDMRRFVGGSEIAPEVLTRLLQAAHAAPSVGLMQPWRFIRITDETLRRRIHALVDATHPYAARISTNAAKAALITKVPLVSLVRPAWIPSAGDDWVEVADVRAAVSAPSIAPPRSVDPTGCARSRRCAHAV